MKEILIGKYTYQCHAIAISYDGKYIVHTGDIDSIRTLSTLDPINSIQEHKIKTITKKKDISYAFWLSTPDISPQILQFIQVFSDFTSQIFTRDITDGKELKNVLIYLPPTTQKICSIESTKTFVPLIDGYICICNNEKYIQQFNTNTNEICANLLLPSEPLVLRHCGKISSTKGIVQILCKDYYIYIYHYDLVTNILLKDKKKHLISSSLYIIDFTCTIDIDTNTVVIYCIANGWLYTWKIYNIRNTTNTFDDSSLSVSDIYSEEGYSDDDNYDNSGTTTTTTTTNNISLISKTKNKKLPQHRYAQESFDSESSIDDNTNTISNAAVIKDISDSKVVDTSIDIKNTRELNKAFQVGECKYDIEGERIILTSTCDGIVFGNRQSSYHNRVTIEFVDSNHRIGKYIEDDGVMYTKASQNKNGQQCCGTIYNNDIKKNTTNWFIRFQPFNDILKLNDTKNKEQQQQDEYSIEGFSFTLTDDEEIICCCNTDTYICIAIKNPPQIRVFTRTGLELIPFTYTGYICTIISYKDIISIFTLYDNNIVSCIDIDQIKCIEKQNIIVPISTNYNSNNTNTIIKWAGYSERGILFIQDSEGIVRMYNGKRKQWIQVLPKMVYKTILWILDIRNMQQVCAKLNKNIPIIIDSRMVVYTVNLTLPMIVTTDQEYLELQLERLFIESESWVNDVPIPLRLQQKFDAYIVSQQLKVVDKNQERAFEYATMIITPQAQEKAVEKVSQRASYPQLVIAMQSQLHSQQNINDEYEIANNDVASKRQRITSVDSIRN